MRTAKTAPWPLCPQSANLYWLPCLGRASYRLSNVFTSRWRWYLHDYACVVLVSRKPPHRCTSGYSALSRVWVLSPYAGCFGVSSLSWPKGLDMDLNQNIYSDPIWKFPYSHATVTVGKRIISALVYFFIRRYEFCKLFFHNVFLGVGLQWAKLQGALECWLFFEVYT